MGVGGDPLARQLAGSGLSYSPGKAVSTSLSQGGVGCQRGSGQGTPVAEGLHQLRLGRPPRSATAFGSCDRRDIKCGVHRRRSLCMAHAQSKGSRGPFGSLPWVRVPRDTRPCTHPGVRAMPFAPALPPAGGYTFRPLTVSFGVEHTQPAESLFFQFRVPAQSQTARQWDRFASALTIFGVPERSVDASTGGTGVLHGLLGILHRVLGVGAPKPSVHASTGDGRERNE